MLSPQQPQQLVSSSQAVVGSGSGGGGGGSGITTTTGQIVGGLGAGSTFSSGSAGPLIGSMATPPLTLDESSELLNLKSIHDQKVKDARLAAFKEVPSNIRQMVIDMLMWTDTASDISQVTVSKDSRLQALETKRDGYNSTFTSSTMGWSRSSYMTGYIAIPDGLTSEDLKKAHLEATVEEEMLDGQEG